MGCDGGTIPTRDELVRTKKKPEQKDKSAELAAKWKHCAITQEPLRAPIMACELGRLYNKESALEFLIDKTKFECAGSFQHLRNLKDVKKLELTENKGYDSKKAEKGDYYIDMQHSGYICPVVGLEMNGKYRFVYLWQCGCVVSERAMKEVKTDVCHKCGKPFSKEDIVILNGNEKEVDEMRTKMEARRLKAKMEKKAKKAEKHKLAVEASTSEGASEASSIKKVKFMEPVNDKIANKHSKLKAAGLKASKSNGKVEEKTDKPAGIQEDPSVSATYKSLFTTSARALNQMKPHWVTFNPLYY